MRGIPGHRKDEGWYVDMKQHWRQAQRKVNGRWVMDPSDPDDGPKQPSKAAQRHMARFGAAR